MKQSKVPYKRLAFVVSLLLIVVWAILGAGTSLAWFMGTAPQVNNIFHTATFDLDVEYLLDDGSWSDLEGATQLFDPNVRYEPGCTQVVFMRVKNNGTVPFDFQLAVRVTDSSVATPNAIGGTFDLKDYLRFGLISASSFAELEARLSDRTLAVGVATEMLDNYSSDPVALSDGETVYIAIVVTMPEDVGNAANFRDGDIPYVGLGLIVSATQQINR